MEAFIARFPFGLILFGLGFFVYWIQAFFIVYHLTRFGIGSRPKIMALAFFIGSILLFVNVVNSYYEIGTPLFFLKFDSSWHPVFPTPISTFNPHY
jgi:hypothetical protein